MISIKPLQKNKKTICSENYRESKGNKLQEGYKTYIWRANKSARASGCTLFLCKTHWWNDITCTVTTSVPVAVKLMVRSQCRLFLLQVSPSLLPACRRGCSAIFNITRGKNLKRTHAVGSVTGFNAHISTISSSPGQIIYIPDCRRRWWSKSASASIISARLQEVAAVTRWDTSAVVHSSHHTASMMTSVAPLVEQKRRQLHFSYSWQRRAGRVSSLQETLDVLLWGLLSCNLHL